MHESAPGTIERPRRFRPQLRYELIDCGVQGHALVGTDVRTIRDEDAIVVREREGLRWYRCLRCDSWLPLAPPTEATRADLGDRDDIGLPLRGRSLRDRYVLRLIALDRAIHVVLYVAVVVLILLFANRRAELRPLVDKIIQAVQGGTVADSGHGLLHDIREGFLISRSSLLLTAGAVAAYAVLEGAEAVGLWFAKRWAEYLTLLATALFLPVEIYELTATVSALKILTLVINLAIVVYLLIAKRLFGVRGGGAAEHRERERDSGWPAIERATPRPPDPASVPVTSAKGATP